MTPSLKDYEKMLELFEHEGWPIFTAYVKAKCSVPSWQNGNAEEIARKLAHIDGKRKIVENYPNRIEQELKQLCKSQSTASE